ncbi:tubulin polyglutamylase complex subunit 1-like isoform X2 [Carpediemonas membranifera]|uniref:Tubulin polyglutamylase complex subunit 1-like isoform X2 n=1 Tax=Carpediemonas membranifera TaxID=201153 RepID=A0A8J6E293_9EUKA|nr:tubulin polyglutamylase complex subunit 1-like isoform X2 [Carpediemonas membranifera]|eukprot:KAG9394046.1 tubulin polyglutamylase complex subunit 1-like isoform X2 [Carpediemonas membranifera]
MPSSVVSAESRDDSESGLTTSALLTNALDCVLLNRPENPIEFLHQYFDNVAAPPSAVQCCVNLCNRVRPNRRPFQYNVFQAYKSINTSNGAEFNRVIVALTASLPRSALVAEVLYVPTTKAVSFDLFNLTVNAIHFISELDARMSFLHSTFDNGSGLISRKITDKCQEMITGIMSTDQASLPSTGVFQDIIDACLGTGRHAMVETEGKGHITVQQDVEVTLDEFRWGAVQIVLAAMNGNG